MPLNHKGGSPSPEGIPERSAQVRIGRVDIDEIDSVPDREIHHFAGLSGSFSGKPFASEGNRADFKSASSQCSVNHFRTSFPFQEK